MALDGVVQLKEEVLEEGSALPARTPAKAEQKHGNYVLERLHALVLKGYKPELGSKELPDFIVLRHLARAPDLVLHEDGTLEGYEGRRPRYKRNVEPPAIIESRTDADQLRFMKFLESVPRASLFDRTRPWRVKYIYIPLALIAIWGLCLAFTAAVVGG